MFVLVRHAHAGNKHKWTGPDELRPLTNAGRRRAEALSQRLATLPIRQVISSPTRRCEQTVTPLAGRSALPLLREPLLLPGTLLSSLLELLASPRVHDAVLCTHREVLEPLLDTWRDDGSMTVSAVPSTPKGAYWVVHGYPGSHPEAVYFPPPGARK